MDLIVFDLDGTLLNRSSALSDYTRETLQRLREREGDGVLDVHLDDLLADSSGELSRLIRFLGLPAPDPAYLAACQSILFDSPRRSALEVDWDGALVRDIERRASQVDFLRRFVA